MNNITPAQVECAARAIERALLVFDHDTALKAARAVLETVRLEGASARSWSAGARVVVNETYFSTLGLPLVAGRPFDASDREGAPPSVIVKA